MIKLIRRIIKTKMIYFTFYADNKPYRVYTIEYNSFIAKIVRKFTTKFVVIEDRCIDTPQCFNK